jgi:probable rRNA maturation factor
VISEGSGRRKLFLNIDVVHGGGLRAIGLSQWLQKIAPANVAGTLTIALLSDQKVRALNRKYRKIDRVTDVLSFSSTRTGTESDYLGDIAIASGVARREAKLAGHSVQNELRLLALHGFLHLLGYDHKSDGGKMALIEGQLRRKGGLQESLLERAKGAQ